MHCSIYLIVSRLCFKSTKPDFEWFTPSNLTVLALSKLPFFTECKYTENVSNSMPIIDLFLI